MHGCPLTESRTFWVRGGFDKNEHGGYDYVDEGDTAEDAAEDGGLTEDHGEFEDEGDDESHRDQFDAESKPGWSGDFTGGWDLSPPRQPGSRQVKADA